MKFIFAVLALCLVATNAAVIEQPAFQYEGLVDDLTQLAVQTAITLEHQLEEIVIDPLQQVDAKVQTIEERREEDDACVADQETVVEAVVGTMHDEMNVCGVVAAKSSAEIMVDINAATQQLVFDGLDVALMYRKCKNYKSSIMKTQCYSRLTVKATLYMKNARRSIKTIKQSTNERVPAVFVDADVCTHSASDKAIVELDNVHASIDSCVVSKRH